MKKFLSLIAITLAISLSLFAQEREYTVRDGAVVVEKVTQFEVTKEDAISALKSFWTSQLVDSNETIKLADDDQLVVKIVTPVLATHSAGFWTTRGNLTIQTRLKDGRMKTTISCNEILNASTTNGYQQSPLDYPPINEDFSTWKYGITKKAALQTIDKLVDYMHDVLSQIDNAVLNAKSEDNW